MKKSFKSKRFKFSLIILSVIIPMILLGAINFVSATCSDPSICSGNTMGTGEKCCNTDLVKFPFLIYTCQSTGLWSAAVNCPSYDCSYYNACSGVGALTQYSVLTSEFCQSIDPPRGVCRDPATLADCLPYQTMNLACAVGLNCQVSLCSGSNSKCHMSNTGAWQWDRIPPGETACSDGYDNDCDGLIDSADPDCLGNPSSPKLKFSQGATSNYAAVIGSNGVMDIRGTLTQNAGTITSTTNDFIIKNSVGTIVALLDYNGNLKLLGNYAVANQATLTGYLGGQPDVIIKSSSGNVVAVFDSSGNLRLLGGLRQSQPNPQ